MIVALLTDSVHPNLYEDDQVLVSAFANGGIDARPVIWDQIDFTNPGFSHAIIRNTWDYHKNLSKFISSMEELEIRGIKLWNPSSIVRWNSTKCYLKEFQSKGINIIPTVWIEKNEPVSIIQRMDILGCDEAVIKPIVGGGSVSTIRFKRNGVDAAEQILTKILNEIQTTVGAMLQPFVPEIVTDGEWSLIFFNQVYSHAVLRKPKSGDFRVQPQHGASAVGINPPQEMISYAEGIIKASGRRGLFARVDLIRKNDGRLFLGELEMIEPRLAFGLSPGSDIRFVNAFREASTVI